MNKLYPCFFVKFPTFFKKFVHFCQQSKDLLVLTLKKTCLGMGKSEIEGNKRKLYVGNYLIPAGTAKTKKLQKSNKSPHITL